MLKSWERTQGFVKNKGLSFFEVRKRTQNEPKTNSICEQFEPENRHIGPIHTTDGRRGRACLTRLPQGEGKPSPYAAFVIDGLGDR